MINKIKTFAQNVWEVIKALGAGCSFLLLYISAIIVSIVATSIFKKIIDNWRKISRALIAIALLLSVSIPVGIAFQTFYTTGSWPTWTGFSSSLDPKGNFQAGKTLWDWFELLIIPAVIAFGLFWFNNQEKQRDIDREDERNREKVFQDYFDYLNMLLLDKGLRISEAESDVRIIARARTMSVLRTLDNTRKALIIKFLAEAKLIQEDAIISLKGADLSGINLERTNLSFVDFSEVDLSKANLFGSKLSSANLQKANLFKAYLKTAWLDKADLSNASLASANMAEANLDEAKLLYTRLNNANLAFGWSRSFGAFLTNTDLSTASLENADLSNAVLTGTNLCGTNLRKTKFSGATRFEGAKYNEKTIWPDKFTPPPNALMCTDEISPE